MKDYLICFLLMILRKPLTKVDTHHPPILVTFEWHELNSSSSNEPIRSFNFKRANYSDMNTFFTSINFAEMFRGRSLDGMAEQLHHVLDDAIQKYVPTYAIKRNDKCPWQNERLQALKNKKN